MPCIRRAAYVLFLIEDRKAVDWPAFVEGIARLSTEPRLHALSVLLGEPVPVSLETLAFLRGITASRWTPEAEVLHRFPDLDPGDLDELGRSGLILSDRPEAPFPELRKRHEKLEAGAWPLYPALYRFMTRRTGTIVEPVRPARLRDLALASAVDEGEMARLLAERGKPPPAFHTAGDVGRSTELPICAGRGDLYEILRSRKTTRAYDRSRSLPFEDLALLLQTVFGSQGRLSLYGRLTCLKKTSPSGGAMHPIEAYPLILNVEGIEPGLYHYSVERHALVPIESQDRGAAEELANLFTVGQSFPRSAHALVILTARFCRSHWKYRHNPRAYAVMLMDAGHLSQTFYLVCAERGLGAFVTAAINEIDIEDRLGIDGIEEGAIAILGCGIPLARPVGLEPEFLPWTPRRSGAASESGENTTPPAAGE